MKMTGKESLQAIQKEKKIDSQTSNKKSNLSGKTVCATRNLKTKLSHKKRTKLPLIKL